MDVKKADTQPNTPVTLAATGAPGTKTVSTSKSAAPGTNAAASMSQSDPVTLSINSLKQSQLATLMTGFQNSLVDTLSAYSPGSGMASLYSLTGTPADKYMNQQLSNLTPEMKKGFMDMYSNLANTAGGLVPQSLISQTFGQTGGFTQFLTSLTNRLNQLPTAPAGFPAIGGTAKSG